MITTADAQRAKKGRRMKKNIITPDFDFILETETADNSSQRSRYRMLLQYGCRTCLKPYERQVIMMHYREGLRLTEISHITGISESTLSHRLRSARGKLFDFAERAAAVQQIISITGEKGRLE